MNIFTQTLPTATAKLIEQIKHLPELNGFYLSGGTALSLQLGHRESEDLDFFSQENFNSEIVQQSLMKMGQIEDVYADKATLNVFLNGVKLQFLHYPYPLLERTVVWNSLKLSSVLDIACTKLITISARGSKKDFIDFYKILQQYELGELFKKLEQKYKDVNYNHVHILKSLVYFNDAEDQPMPRMHVNVKWEDVKHEIEEKAKMFEF